ncbi:putative oxidoreductase UxuB [Anaerolineae bacterium]|nr:putative oxidoreductase UxuB [Anaerolineae bacterium]
MESPTPKNLYQYIEWTHFSAILLGVVVSMINNLAEYTMNSPYLTELFSLQNQVAVVTGAGGALANALVRGLVQAGARAALLDRNVERGREFAEQLTAQGAQALFLTADVLNREQLEADRDVILKTWGRIDILVNLAGGNVPAATVADDQSFFGVPLEALRSTFDLNWTGTVLPSQVFGEVMAQQKSGSIVNISSMAAQRPLTRVIAYASAKAGIDNFTRWLAIEMARKYGEGLRVNAIAPGFFIGAQNRAMLLNPDGSLTDRGKKIIAQTPAGRFGEAEELVGALIWLCSPAARFVTGVVIPVDGGYSAFGGV